MTTLPPMGLGLTTTKSIASGNGTCPHRANYCTKMPSQADLEHQSSLKHNATRSHSLLQFPQTNCLKGYKLRDHYNQCIALPIVHLMLHRAYLCPSHITKCFLPNSVIHLSHGNDHYLGHFANYNQHPANYVLANHNNPCTWLAMHQSKKTTRAGLRGHCLCTRNSLYGKT